MPIIYSLVARETTVLAEFTSTSGNFTTITRTLLSKIDQEKMSYVYDKHAFHHIIHDGMTFLCMADEAMGRNIPFAFLEDIKNRWVSTYSDQGKTAMSYAMNQDFPKILQKQMNYFNNSGNEKVTAIQGEVDEVQSIMQDNIDKVIGRGERIDLLVGKSENLNTTAFRFKKNSTTLKRAMWWKNMKLTLIIVFIVFFFIYFIISMFCGGPLLPDCIKKSDSNDSGDSHKEASSREVETAVIAGRSLLSLLA
eukprot:TRINITY_DN106_c0_g1_i1.p1 TRINITY_DN106_c0_g1~~TRINITY_DN106_c0_g1_i1.p1  ORF type:complete len:251 (+),score=63.09 TRINITY_DN106_c0_g1_i1:129-881(+)